MLAIDTETTGLDIKHGCRPFFVVAADEKGEILYWEWDVDPTNRQPQIPKEDIKEIQELIDDAASDAVNRSHKSKFTNAPIEDPACAATVFHNIQFDVAALESIGIVFSSEFWQSTHDTLCMSHVFNSLEPHSLKPLCLQYLKIEDDDEKALQDACNAARRVGRKHSWDLAVPNHPHWPGFKKAAKNAGWWKCDMWLPKAVCVDATERSKLSSIHQLLSDPILYSQYADPEHPWWTVLKTYALRDGERTICLWQMYLDALTEEKLWDQYIQTHKKLFPVVHSIQHSGVTLKPKTLDNAIVRYADKCEALESRSQKISSKREFNPRSPDQLKQILYGKYNLPKLGKTAKGNPSTNHETLLKLRQRCKERMNGNFKNNNNSDDKPPNYQVSNFNDNTTSRYRDAYEFITAILMGRKFKTSSGYLEAYRNSSVISSFTTDDKKYKKYRLHFSLNQTGTRTTRFSSSNPNSQNVAKPEDGSSYSEEDADLAMELKKSGLNLRAVFGPTPDRVWYAMDYKQLQLRIFAYVSEEQTLIDAFDSGWDAHDYMAHRIFELPDDRKPTASQRRIAKNVNFGFVFGASASRIDSSAGRPGLMAEVMAMFPNARKFINTTIKQVRKKGYVTTSSGYRLYVPEEMPYAGVNYLVQGDEGVIVRDAMIKTHNFLQKYTTDSFITLQVHDEIVFDLPKPIDNKNQRLKKGLSEKDRQETTIITLKNLMQSAGKITGIISPVSVDKINKNWSEGEEVNI